MDKLSNVLAIWLECLTGKQNTLPHLLESAEVTALFKKKYQTLYDFLTNKFPSCVDVADQADVATCLILIYIAFRTDEACELPREILCKLDHSLQLPIQQFLQKLEKYKDKFQAINLEVLDAACEDLKWQSSSERAVFSPVSTAPYLVASPDTALSPLQTYFQTPHRTPQRRQKKGGMCRICSGGDRLKQLQLQLEEEDNEKISLLKRHQEAKATISELEHKLTTERCKSSNLTQTVASLEADVRTHLEEIELMQGNYKEVERSNKILAEDIQYVNKCLADVTKERDLLEITNVELKTEADVLRTSNEDKLSAIQLARRQLAELTEIAEGRKLAISELEDKMEELKSSLVANDNSLLYQSFQPGECLGDQLLMHAQQDVKNLTAEIEKLHTDNKLAIAKSEDRIKLLTDDLEARDLELKNIRLAQSALEEKLREMDKIHAEKIHELERESEEFMRKLEEDRHSWEKEVEGLSDKLDASEKAAFCLQQHEKSLNLQLEEIQNILASERKCLSDERIRFDAEIGSLREDHRLEKEMLKNDLQSMSNEVSYLHELLGTTLDKEVKLTEDLKRAESVIEEKDTENSMKTKEFCEKIAELERRLSDEHIVKTSAFAKIKDLNDIVKTHQERVTETEKELETLSVNYSRELLELGSECEAFKESFNKLNDELIKEKAVQEDMKLVEKALHEEINKQRELLCECNCRIENLQKEVESLKIRQEESQAIIDEKKSIISDLENTKEQLTIALNEEVSTNSKAEAKLKDLQCTVVGYEEKINELNCVIETLRIEMVTLNESHVQIKNANVEEIKSLKTTKLTLERMLDEKNHQIDEFEVLVADLRQQVRDLQDAISEKLLTIEGYQKNEVASKLKVKELMSQLNTLNADCAEKSASLNQLEAEKAVFVSELQEVSNEVSRLMSAMEERSRIVQNLLNEKDDATSQITELEETVRMLRGDNEKFKENERLMSSELEDAKKKLQEQFAKVNELTITYEKSQNECERLEKQRQDLMSALDTSSEQVRNLTKEKDGLISKMAELHENILMLVADKNSKTIEFEELMSKIDASEFEMKNMLADLERLTTELQVSEKIIEELKTETADREKQLVDETVIFKESEKLLTSQLEDVRDKLQQQHTKINELTSAYEVSQKECGRLESEVKDLKTQLSDESESSKRVEAEISTELANTKVKLQEQDSEVCRLSDECKVGHLALDQLRAEVDDLQQKHTEEIANLNQKQDSQLKEAVIRLDEQLLQVKRLTTERQQSEVELEELTNEVADLKKQLVDENSNFDQKYVLLMSQFEEAKTLLQQKEVDTHLLEAELEDSKKRYDQLKSETVSLEKQLDENTLKFTQLNVELNDAKNKYLTQEEHANQLKAQYVECLKNIEQMEAEAEELRKKFEDQVSTFNLAKKQHCVELEDAEARLEQQAVEFARLKMQLTTELEQHQRESATMVRQLEAKNLSLDEVKNVAMTKVHELLRSHGQLKQELGELVAVSSAKNSILDSQVKQAESKCQDLSADLANALSNVDNFKLTVQQLRQQQDHMVRQLKEKEEIIQQLNRECESRKKSANIQINSIKNLLDAVKILPASQTSEASPDGFSNILDKLREELEARTARQNETLEALSRLRNDVHVLQCEKIKLQNIVDKPCVKYWATAQVKELFNKLDTAGNGKEIAEMGKLVDITSEQSMGDDTMLATVSCLAENMTMFKNILKKLIGWVSDLQNIADARETLLQKAGEDYKALERRTCSLAEVNSKLSTEILRAKNLSSTELNLREGDLTSLKTTVSALNTKIQQLTIKNSELETTVSTMGSEKRQLASCNNELTAEKVELVKELSSLKESRNKALSICKNHFNSDVALFEVLKTSEDITVSLHRLRSEVPEMLTVITTLEHQREIAARELLTTVSSISADCDAVVNAFLDNEIESISNNCDKLNGIHNCLKNIQENVCLIEAKRVPDELSDSLEEVAIPDKTFPIINLHEDTFCMPPSVDEAPHPPARSRQPPSPVVTARGASAWQLSPPSSKKPIKKKPAAEKQERQHAGESWVVPIGPAPAKPARKSEPRPRSDSTSSTKSLPPQATARSSQVLQESKGSDFDVVVRQLKKEKDVLAKECHKWKARAIEIENQRDKEIKEYATAKASTRERFEKQLESIKVEMKKLYNQEMAKHKAEQSRAANELKVKHDELLHENATLKEAMDDLRNQLWTLGDKYLQEQSRNKDGSDLSRKLDRITLMPADSWSLNGIKDEVDGGNSKTQGTSKFPPMPMEDEEEVFDNRYLDDLKAGVRDQSDSKARLTELQIRNSMVPPHLKSSYPGETQFASPGTFSDDALRTCTLPFTSESHSLTDSSGDPSMTRSLIPTEKSKKKDQTSYKRPGPPTPSKHGRPSLTGDPRILTPRAVLREQNIPEKTKGTPSRLKSLFRRRESIGMQDENSAPSTPRGKRLGIFPRKPFGGRDF